jgi:large exoprotein involved in heme utilization and adhesion
MIPNMVRVVRRNRQALMVSTALQAAMIVLSLPTHAQPAPNVRPVGGTVVGGSAAISQTTSNTQINQSSQRAAINWQSFDVGSQQRVTFAQPNASAAEPSDRT